MDKDLRSLLVSTVREVMATRTHLTASSIRPHLVLAIENGGYSDILLENGGSLALSKTFINDLLASEGLSYR